MSSFDDLINEATSRLAIDRELQMDVAQELRHHLEDAVAAFEDADFSPEEARIEAAKAFGDPGQLAESLFTANRARIRMRSWLKWILRVSLVPACLVITFYFALSGIWGIVAMERLDSILVLGKPLPQIFPTEAERLRGKLSEDDYLIVFGVENHTEAGVRFADFQARHERWPNDPMFLANYINAASHHWAIHGVSDSSPAVASYAPDPKQIQRYRDLLEKRRQLEPDNGYYDLLEAALLFDHACEIEIDRSATRPDLKWDSTNQKLLIDEDAHPPQLTIHDQALFDEALAYYKRAAESKFIEDYRAELTERQMMLLPAPEHRYELIDRMSRSIGTLLPALGKYRRSARAVSLHAVTLAEDGDVQTAETQTNQVSRVNGLCAANSKVLIEILTYVSIDFVVQRARYDVAVAAGLDDEAAKRWEQYKAHFVGYKQAISDPDRRLNKTTLQGADTLGRLIAPAISGLQFPFKAFREIEYSLADRTVLAFVMLLFDGLLIVFALLAGVLLWRRRHSASQPVLIWPTLTQLAIVCGFGVALPLILFGLYAWASPLSPREFGIIFVPAQIATEYALLATGICVTTWHLAVETIRRRAADIGIPTPSPATPRQQPLVFGLLAFVTVISILRQLDVPPVAAVMHESVPVVMVLLAAAVWALRQLAWTLESTFSGRSLPKYLFAAVALSCLAAMLVLFISPRWLLVGSSEAVFFTYLTAAIVGGLFLLYAVVRAIYAGSRSLLFTGSLIRSLPPVLGAAAVFVAIVAGPVLSQIETSRVTQAQRRLGPSVFSYEVERSDFRFVRAYLVEGKSFETLSETVASKAPAIDPAD